MERKKLMQCARAHCLGSARAQFCMLLMHLTFSQHLLPTWAKFKTPNLSETIRVPVMHRKKIHIKTMQQDIETGSKPRY